MLIVQTSSSIASPFHGDGSRNVENIDTNVDMLVEFTEHVFTPVTSAMSTTTARDDGKNFRFNELEIHNVYMSGGRDAFGRKTNAVRGGHVAAADNNHHLDSEARFERQPLHPDSMTILRRYPLVFVREMEQQSIVAVALHEDEVEEVCVVCARVTHSAAVDIRIFFFRTAGSSVQESTPQRHPSPHPISTPSTARARATATAPSPLGVCREKR